MSHHSGNYKDSVEKELYTEAEWKTHAVNLSDIIVLGPELYLNSVIGKDVTKTLQKSHIWQIHIV